MNGILERKMSENAPNVNRTIGMCQCGCGKQAPIASKTSSRNGWIKNMPIRFISGHNGKLQPKGTKAYRWKGGIKTNYQNRVLIYKPYYHRSYADGYVLRAVFIVEEVLGKRLPKGSVVHHNDENPNNDNHENLVVCENRAYHLLLHRRISAFKNSGHPNWRKCSYCGQYDNPDKLYISPRNNARHRSCAKKYMATWKNRRTK